MYLLPDSSVRGARPDRIVGSDATAINN